MASEGAVRIVLVTENPFARDDVGTGGRGYKGPGVVMHESIIFFLHSLTPGRIA
jgi:hypothetical protein